MISTISSVILVGPKFFHYNDSVRRALEKMGHRVYLIEYGELFNDITHLNRLRYKLARDHDEFVQEQSVALNRQILKMYRRVDPAFVLFIKGARIFPETLRQIRCRKAIWLMDSIALYPELAPLLPLVDLRFVYERTDVDWIARNLTLSAEFLPLGADVDLFRPMPSIPKEIDILFVGALYEGRIAALNKLIKRFPDRRIVIYGKRVDLWDDSNREPARALPKKNYMRRNIQPRELASLYASAKICLNLHHEQQKYGANPRFFEIAACDAVQVLDQNQYLKETFPSMMPKTFGNVEELLDSIATLDLEEATRSATLLGQSVRSHHTIEERVRKIDGAAFHS